MPPRRSWPAVLIALAGCARLVGLDELSEEPPGSEVSNEPGTVESAGGASGRAAADPSAPDRTSDDPVGGSTGGPMARGGTSSDTSAGSASTGNDAADDLAPLESADAGTGRSECSAASDPAAPGTDCGSLVDDECTRPDSCDGQGNCQRNDEPLGTPCEGGTCSGGLCIAAPPSGCVVDAVSSVPFTASWSSVNRPDLYDGGCDTEGTPDYALVFTAPATAVYRIASAALVDAVPYTGPIPDGPADGDAVMTIARGDCAGGEAQQLACNDDVQVGTLNSQVDLGLAAGEVVTVYLNELGQMGGGTGTVSIDALP